MEQCPKAKDSSSFDPRKASVVGVNKKNLEKQDRDSDGYLDWNGVDVVKDHYDRTFIGGENFRYGSDQMLLSRILKGIIPVSDVVFVRGRWWRAGGGQFYSHDLPLDNIQEVSNPFNVNEAAADAFILKFIFGDADHGWELINEKEGHNFVIKNDKYAFFDFEYFNDFWSAPHSYGNYFSEVNCFSGEQKGFLNSRLSQLSAHIGGEDGLNFLRDIVKSIEKSGAGIPDVIKEAPGEDKVKSFQYELVKRISLLQEALSSGDN